MSYHKDPEVNQALIRLLDALCTWERNAGRRSTLILVPHCSDERILMAQDGKPQRSIFKPEFLLELALKDREESK